MKSPYYDKLPTTPYELIIKGSYYTHPTNELHIDLRYYTPDDIRIFYDSLDAGLSALLMMREDRIARETEIKERAELNRLKAKYEK